MPASPALLRWAVIVGVAIGSLDARAQEPCAATDPAGQWECAIAVCKTTCCDTDATCTQAKNDCVNNCFRAAADVFNERTRQDALATANTSQIDAIKAQSKGQSLLIAGVGLGLLAMLLVALAVHLRVLLIRRGQGAVDRLDALSRDPIFTRQYHDDLVDGIEKSRTALRSQWLLLKQEAELLVEERTRWEAHPTATPSDSKVGDLVQALGHTADTIKVVLHSAERSLNRLNPDSQGHAISEMLTQIRNILQLPTTQLFYSASSLSNQLLNASIVAIFLSVLCLCCSLFWQ